MTLAAPSKPAPATQQAIHFEGLNAFRFFAASLVVLVHAQDARLALGPGGFNLGMTENMGGLAVTFFFVLSGFLITYLLLKEKATYHTVAVRKFYVRRVLRIWPLYYLVVGIAFALLDNPAVLPSIADKSVYASAPVNLLLYLGFLPNVAWITGLQILYANQLWSVGVEEQFYLFWPLLVKRLRPNSILNFMVGLVVFFLLARNGAAWLAHRPLPALATQALNFTYTFLTVTRLSCMAIGGIGAYAYYYRPSIVARLVALTGVDMAVVLAIGVLGVRNTFIPYAMHEVFSILFCYVILSAACKPHSVLKLENAAWRWLGNLSYGIYMWHMIVLGLVVMLVRKASLTTTWQLDACLYAGVLVLTIGMAWLSYAYVEKPFLRLKQRFMLIQSKA